MSGPPDRRTRLRQMFGVMRLELRRNLLAGRAFALYFLALAPVALVALWAMTPLPTRELSGPGESAAVFAAMYQLYLRVSLFLSTLFMFMSLFRSEVLQRSLHYYFLTPVRREILVLGKYLAALIAACFTFAVGTASLYLLMIVPFGTREASHYLFQGPGFGHLLAYIGISVLAVAGYGAVFLLVGLFFRNPVVPAVVIWGWELINFVLPPLLKKISVVHYLRSLYPIPPLQRAFEVTVEPTPAWISVPGILLFTVMVIAAAAWRARRMEVSYGAD